MKEKLIYGASFALFLMFICANASSQNRVTLTFPTVEGNSTNCNLTTLSNNITNLTSVTIGNNNWVCINVIDHTFHTCSCTEIDVTQLIFQLMVQTIQQGAGSILSSVGSFILNLFR